MCVSGDHIFGTIMTHTVPHKPKCREYSFHCRKVSLQKLLLCKGKFDKTLQKALLCTRKEDLHNLPIMIIFSKF